MVFGQLASAAMLFEKFDAGRRKSLSDFWPPLFEQPIKFVLIIFLLILFVTLFKKVCSKSELTAFEPPS